MAVNDLVSLEATVLAVSGSTFRLSNVLGLAVGDSIIIESTHGYNEDGLDGNWTITNFPIAGNGYYTRVTKVGKSFIAAVTALSGNLVTVGRAVPSACQWKTCYRDNSAAVKYALENGVTWPTRRRFATATADTVPLIAYLTDTYQDINFNHCEIFSPKGCGALSLSIVKLGGGDVSNKRYRNLTLRGNARDAGYGVIIQAGLYVQGTSLPAVLNIGGISNVVENVNFIDNWRDVMFSYSTDSLCVHCRSTFTAPLRQYIQWCYGTNFATRCRFEDCSVIDKNGMRAAFEPFRSDGVMFVRCGGENSGFSNNTSNNTLFDDCNVSITVENPNASWSPNNPILNLNNTIAVQQGSAEDTNGIVVRDFSVQYKALPYPATKKIFNTILLTPSVGATIDGVTLTIPAIAGVTPIHTNAGYLVGSDSTSVTAAGLVGPASITEAKFAIAYVAQPEEP